MEYLTVKEIGEKWGITSRMVNVYCTKGRIPGAVKKGNVWLIPENAKKPEDLRKKDK
jgi:predicted site-specific integrase-resolvase